MHCVAVLWNDAVSQTTSIRFKVLVEAGRIELPSKTVGPSVKPRASPLYFFSTAIYPGAG